MELHYAESGRSGIELLQRIPDADVALVDIMMPGMDGYETIREIRSMSSFAGMPIVAVTAKAMKGDRQKCIEAGASDYVAKPVDMEQLISVLRVWLQRADHIGTAKSSENANVLSFPTLAG
jgi:CheY-like chemotaxis protein